MGDQPDDAREQEREEGQKRQQVAIPDVEGEQPVTHEVKQQITSQDEIGERGAGGVEQAGSEQDGQGEREQQVEGKGRGEVLEPVQPGLRARPDLAGADETPRRVVGLTLCPHANGGVPQPIPGE